MSDNFVCEAFEANGTIGRYVAGVLDARKSAQFEDHFVTCERCQSSIAAGAIVRKTPAVGRRITPVWVMLATAASLGGPVPF